VIQIKAHDVGPRPRPKFADVVETNRLRTGPASNISHEASVMPVRTSSGDIWPSRSHTATVNQRTSGGRRPPTG